MKSNNFLIALALCLGISSTASFCAQQPTNPSSSGTSSQWFAGPRKSISDFFKSAQAKTHAAASYVGLGSMNIKNWGATKFSGALGASGWVLYKILYGIYNAGYTTEDVLNYLRSITPEATWNNAIKAIVAATVAGAITTDVAPIKGK